MKPTPELIHYSHGNRWLLDIRDLPPHYNVSDYSERNVKLRLMRKFSR